MEAEDLFVSNARLICEPSRAKMLWNLLDGRAYTASELATVADLTPTAVSNHLSKLLDADIIKVEAQGRHRYYSFARPEVAYVVESLANLTNKTKKERDNNLPEAGIKFCRTCYDHLAGYVGVKLIEVLENHKYLVKTGTAYDVTKKGWMFFKQFGISNQNFENSRRPLTLQCLDWSERKPHLAGQLGALLLEKMFENKWFRRVRFSRELVLTAKGRESFEKFFGVSLY